MKNFKTRFVALCGLMVLAAASLAPIVAEAQTCPTIRVVCSSGKVYGCTGTRNGDRCTYSADCLNGGRCGIAE